VLFFCFALFIYNSIKQRDREKKRLLFLSGFGLKHLLLGGVTERTNGGAARTSIYS
jgi:hypothetical protein